jgi:uncharacterized membrane protein
VFFISPVGQAVIYNHSRMNWSGVMAMYGMWAFLIVVKSMIGVVIFFPLTQGSDEDDDVTVR